MDIYNIVGNTVGNAVASLSFSLAFELSLTLLQLQLHRNKREWNDVVATAMHVHVNVFFIRAKRLYMRVHVQ